MSVESNIDYLDYEIKSNKERITAMKKYLEEHPAVSIYKRKLNRKTYYYKKFRKDGKSISEYIGSDKNDMEELLKKLQANSLERKKIKEHYYKLKKINIALEKQLKIARRAYNNG